MIVVQLYSKHTEILDKSIFEIQKKYTKTFYQRCNGVEYRVSVNPTFNEAKLLMSGKIEPFTIWDVPCNLNLTHTKSVYKYGEWTNITFNND
jgi:hypothetical protein